MKRTMDDVPNEDENKEKIQHQVTFKASDTFIKTIGSVKELVNDVTFYFSQEGLEVSEVDASKIAMVSLSSNSSVAFEKFDCPTNQTISISLEKSWSFLKSVDKDSVMTWSFTPESNHLDVELNTKSKCKCSPTLILFTERKETYQIHQLFIEKELFDSEGLEVKDSVELNSQELQKIITKISNWKAPEVTIGVDKEKKSLVFSCPGEGGCGTIELAECSDEVCKLLNQTLTPHKGDEIIFNVERNWKKVFSVAKLTVFTKASSLCKRVNMGFTDNGPIVLKYEIPQVGKLSFFLAPRLEDGE